MIYSIKLIYILNNSFFDMKVNLSGRDTKKEAGEIPVSSFIKGDV